MVNILGFLGRKKGRIEREWEYQADSPLLNSPAIGHLKDGKKLIVFGTKEGKIYTLDDQSKLKWFFDIKEKRSEIDLLFLDEDTLKSIRCPPVLADIDNDGKLEIIVGSDNGTLYVLDEAGKPRWEYSINTPIRSSAIVANLTDDPHLDILFGGNDCFLYALDSKGNLLWKFKANSPIESVPSLLPAKELQIIFGSNDGTIYSLNREGQKRWEFRTEGKISAQPAIADLSGEGSFTIIIGSQDSSLYAIDEKGNLLWKFKTEGSIYSRACLADINNDKKLEIIFGSCDNSVYALDCQGHKIWSYETDFWVVVSPFVTDIDNDGKPEVVAGSYDHSLYVLDAEGSFMLNYMPGISGIAQQPGHYSAVMTSQPGQYQGKKIWEYKTDSFIVGSAYLEDKDNKKIIVGTKKGALDLFKHKE
jgi:outer membrane protein assembly factor BamB